MLQPLQTTWSNKLDLCCRRLPVLPVARCYNHYRPRGQTSWTCAAGGCLCSLWPDVTTITDHVVKQVGLVLPEVACAPCGQMLQPLQTTWSNKLDWCCRRLPVLP